MLITLPSLSEDEARLIIEAKEKNVGKKRSEIGIGEENEEKGDAALAMALARFYAFRVPESDSSRLRFRAFALAQQLYGGCVPHAERPSFLEQCALQGIEERMLWLDSEEHHTFARIKKPGPEDLISAYRYYSLFVVAKKAAKLTARFDGEIKAGVIRDLYFLAKKYAMLCDFTPHEIEVYPPEELLPRKYGYILIRFLRNLMRYSPKEVAFSIGPRGFQKQSFSPADIRSCLSIELAEEAESFDSSVERNFAAQFGPERQHFRLVRDPFPIIKGDLIVMPDFALDLHVSVPGAPVPSAPPSERPEKRLYLEIIGYWRPEYIRRKKEKLRLLLRYDVPLLLLVDEKLRKHFADLAGAYPIVHFGKSFPLCAIEEYLKAHGRAIYEAHRDRWDASLAKAAEGFAASGRAFIDSAEIEALGFLKDEFCARVQGGDFLPGYILLPAGLVKKSLMLEMAGQNLEGPVADVEKRLAERSLPLKVIPSLGYRIVWASLASGRVRKC